MPRYTLDQDGKIIFEETSSREIVSPEHLRSSLVARISALTRQKAALESDLAELDEAIGSRPAPQ